MSEKNKSNETLLRQWEMLRSIPSRDQRITTSALASRLRDKGYSVSIRTIQRDLNTLTTHFGINCDGEGSRQVWFWMPGGSLDILNLSISDALSIKMMEDYLVPLLPAAIVNSLSGRFKQAEKRLESINNPLTRWAEKIRTVTPSQPLKAPVIAPGILETVQTALINEHQLKITYRGRRDKPASEFILHPLALVLRSPASYLVATAFSYEDVRIYALHRFESAEELEDDAEFPADFSIDAYIKAGGFGFGSGGDLLLKLRVQKELQVTLSEAALADDMVITPEGENTFIATATVQDTWQLKWWILSQGPKVEVLEPASLRQSIQDELRAALAAYQ